MNSRIPSEIRLLLEDYCGRLDQEIPGKVEAFYLVGSIALDGFNPDKSDIDFVALLNHPASDREIEQLRKIHREIDRRYRRWKLEGMYLQISDLGCDANPMAPYLNYHDEKLQPRNRMVLSSITWWILKNCGIALFGPEPSTLELPIDMDLLRAEQIENLHSYWASWTRRPGRILNLLPDWGVEWAVLGVLRLVYTLQEHAITTKRAAGEYGLTFAPPHFHRIIREALRLREGSRIAYYRSKLKRAADAVELMRWVLRRFPLQAEAAPNRPSG